jgi:hypothetical protein
VAATVLVCGACAHRPDRAVPSSPPNLSSASDDSWAGSSWEDRHDTMTFVVQPSMAKLFAAFEQTPDPDLTCRTCHGANAEAVAYKMPNGLSPLNPAHMPDPGVQDPKARMVKFMIEEVTPRMAALLEVEPYDPKTKRGFWCFNCHPARP